MLDPTLNDSLSRSRHRLRALDWLIALVILVATAWLLASTDQMGFTRDESFYFTAGRDYAGWFDELDENLELDRGRASLQQDSIDRHWGYNPEHPVLMKTLFGLSWDVLHVRRGWIGPSLAMRLPAIMFAAWLIAMIYAFAFEVIGSRLGALSAAAMMLLMPRFFFHAHMTCFDVPMVTVWFAVIYAFWKSLDHNGWAWVTGALWGVALITKLNAFFIPIVLLAWWAIAGWWRFSLRGGRLRVPPVPRALFAMILLGPVIFYAGWPRHWFDTYHRVLWYVRFHLQHEHYFVDYFGQNLWRPPFPVDFPFVMTAVTTPVVILALWLLGAGWLLVRWLVSLRRDGPGAGDRFGTGVLLALNIAVPFLIIARPDTPIFGGIKHWFTALPYLCVLGGWAIARLVDLAGGIDAAKRTLAAVLLVSSFAVPAGLATRDSHPFGTSYYNELMGGYTGAAERRTMRQFWGYASRQALPWLNEHAPEGADVFWHNTTIGAFEMYKEEGLLREDLRYAWNMTRADVVVYHHQQAFAAVQAEAWYRMNTFSPAHTVTIAGVPVISVYVRREPDEPMALDALRAPELPRPVLLDAVEAAPGEAQGSGAEGSGHAR